MPLVGTPQGRTLAGQTVIVEPGEADSDTRLYAPVTNRGEAIGVIELRLSETPDEWTLADIYAGYADDHRAATEGPDADATGAGVEDPGEWTLADIYAGYADAESDSVATVDGDR